MFLCRLFHCDRPFEEIDARFLADGQITLGRDPAADWQLPDADDRLSRLHCSLTVEGDKVILCDLSTNGTFLPGGERAPRGIPIEIGLREPIGLGSLSLLIDEAEPKEACNGSTTGPSPSPEGEPAAMLARVQRPHPDVSLLESFCAGAGLDAAALSGEDPTALMERIGAIYQQTVLGLASLVAERARLKSERELDRTKIGAVENNPFKWASTRTLRQNVLQSERPGFLAGPDAVRASFEDVAKHLAAVVRAAEAATELVMSELAPEAIEVAARAQGSVLRSRAAVCWEIHKARHVKLQQREVASDPIRQAFVEAYGRAIAEARP